MLEEYSFYVLLVSLALAVVGAVWLLVVAFKERVLWAFAILFLLPAPLVFIMLHWRKARLPVLVLLLAGVLGGATSGVNYYNRRFPDLGPREKLVNGERHLTLTGWDRTDYSFLQYKPDTIVLQMANSDVSDQTLSYLRGMDRLRELDLNYTSVTDEGLVVLSELPQLEELRLARTAITDEGFQKYLAAKESLQKLDLTGTKVKGKSKRDWKKAKEGREYLD